MLPPSSFPAAGRLLIAALAMTVSGLSCATFGAHDSTLDGTVSSRAFRARATLNAVKTAGTETYIDRILVDRDSTVERWPDHASEPLRVWIDSNRVVSGDRAGFPTAVRGAFSQWAATGIPVRFTFVSSPRDADIRVRWTEHLEKKTGSTTWRTDRSGSLTRGDITLATHMGDGGLLDARGMRAIALHEVGHALGLSHSTDASDIMAPLVRVDGLSMPDRETIKLLYSLPAGSIR